MHPCERRRRRADHLAAKQPHAAASLRYYAALVDIQRTLYDTAMAAAWRDLASTSLASAGPAWVAAIPETVLDEAFLDLLDRLRDVDAATDVVRAACRAGLDSGPSARSLLLRTVAAREAATPAQAGGPTPASALIGFACLQPLAEALAAGSTRRQEGATTPNCPVCDWAPVAGEMHDDGDVRGQRRLICALCGSAWPFPRGVCSACGEARSDRLDAHVAESLPHIRVEACTACGVYLKAMDLRIDGLAVAQVDDIASLELDLWASGQGLAKRQANVLGL